MKLVSVETPEKSVCKMTFSASAEELEAASNAVYERTRATYTIKGFAKGEADRAQIEADRGEHTFWYDAINDLMDKDVPALYNAAMAEHGFHAVDEPVYDLVSVKKDEGFVATATTALQPELNLTQTTGFKTECVTPEVTDKEIDAVLERRRAMAAELVPHKGPAVKGNIVHIDYEGLLEGKPFNGGTAQNQTLQLGSGRMIPGFEEGILGHKGGEEFDIFVTFPARYHAKDLAGKPVVFKIKLHDVCVRQLPALNSDFAKKAANVDTMDEFRAQIRQQLHDNKHAAALNRADLLQRAGQYPPPPGWPEWYGLEAAGVIESYWGNENAGARRRYYHLTDEGRRLYEENREDWRKYRAVISQLIGLEEDEHDEQADSQHD